MKHALFALIALLVSCSNPSPRVITPQEHAIARFIKSHMTDTTSYTPISTQRQAAYSRRDVIMAVSERLQDAIEDNLPSQLDREMDNLDSVAYLHVLDRFVEEEKQHMRLYYQTSPKKIGSYYEHTYKYENRDGHKVQTNQQFRVSDSLNIVRSNYSWDKYGPLN